MGDMSFSSVEEITDEICPVINTSSLKVYDDKNQKLYVYGGIRWPGDENDCSPTVRPTSDFHVFRPHPYPRWDNYTIHMRRDESLISPFEETLSRPDSIDLTLPKLGSLPVLLNPIGAIVHDETASRTTYLLILGDPFGKDLTKYQHPILICINLKLNTWRYVKLKNSERVTCGRMYGSMIVTGELRAPDSDAFLCVFGGVNEDVDAFTYTYRNTFAVANLSRSTWIIPNGSVPPSIGPLGVCPALAKYRCEPSTRELILILGKAAERQPLDNKNIANASAKADFSSAFFFDPHTKVNQFCTINNNPSRCFPRPARTYLLQRSQTLDKFCEEFLVVTCGRQRPFNKFPKRPTGAAQLRRIYIKPKVRVWIASIREAENHPDSRPDDEQGRTECDLNMDPDDSSSAEDTSSDSDDSAAREDRKGVLAQRAVKSGREAVRSSGKIMTWRNVSGGRVKQSLDHLTDSFRIEYLFLRGELSTHAECCEYSLSHQLSPTLILLGCDHEYLGEIRAEVFNAFAGISLRSLCDAEEDDSESEALSISDEETVSSEPTAEYGESNNSVLLYEAGGLSIDDDSDIGEGENAMPQTPNREDHEMLTQSESGAYAYDLMDGASDVAAAESYDQPHQEDDFHLMSESDAEVESVPMDFEIEALVENIMDTYVNSPSDEVTIDSVWSDGYVMDVDTDFFLASPALSTSESES